MNVHQMKQFWKEGQPERSDERNPENLSDQDDQMYEIKTHH